MFLNLIKKRRSVRSYLSKPVERKKIELCLEAARLAPSACNSQPWSFIVVTDENLKNQIAQKTYSKLIPMNKFTENAPVLVIIVKEASTLLATFAGIWKRRHYSLIDIGIAAEHFCLQAAELDLGTCMLGWFNERKIKNILKIPRHKRLALIITVGYPESEEIPPKKRKLIDDIRRYV
ncbi:NAD(P)H nitroreductase [bacterium]|mgnify:CR=1 FL=1|jgi:nitroreductase|nr:NAD(P)H nitroreductase [bacterium]MBT3580993.1 NAD(P)H nitroreductase [bacterium]MBT4551778.1 NAD(P)H nitroreductase [bacterium]MBT5988920.1 NAD(P)H nitroreductase [bacterium]MBT7087438.1 NAD(P)H nitroreductase [bacterium]